MMMRFPALSSLDARYGAYGEADAELIFGRPGRVTRAPEHNEKLRSVVGNNNLQTINVSCVCAFSGRPGEYCANKCCETRAPVHRRAQD
jgi:hypothetical protein